MSATSPHPAPVRRTQEERTALSDGRMVEAAIALIVENGLSGTTLAAIGERAGYSRGLATHRFGSKAGLLAYVYEHVNAHWLARVQQAVGEEIGIAALQRGIDALYGYVNEEPDEIRAMHLLRYASIDPGSDYRANVEKAHAAQRRDVQRWIEAGQAAGRVHAEVDAAVAAEVFLSSVDGLIYRWLVNPQRPISALAEAMKREVHRSLRP